MKNILLAARVPTRAARVSRALALATLLIAPTVLSGQTRSQDFENNTLAPFNAEVAVGNESVVGVPAGLAARNGFGVHRMTWYEANYAGTRITRGVEGSSGGNTNNPRITDEGWFAFSFYAKSGELPPDKSIIIAQIICWHPTLPNTDKTLTVSRGNDNSLSVTAYSGTGGAATRTGGGVLLPEVAFDRWHDVVIYTKFANNGTGALKVWVNGAPEDSPTYAVDGINIGNGAFTSPNVMTHGGYMKWGLYNFDTAGYVPGESRTIYFDELAYQTGNPAGAYDLVAPTGDGGGDGPPPRPPLVWEAPSSPTARRWSTTRRLPRAPARGCCCGPGPSAIR